MSSNVEAQAKRYYPKHWSLENLKSLVDKGKLTAAEFFQVTGEEYGETVKAYDFTGMSAADVKRSLSYRPTLDELRQACDWLKLDWDTSMTRAQLIALIDAAAEAEASGGE